MGTRVQTSDFSKKVRCNELKVRYCRMTLTPSLPSRNSKMRAKNISSFFECRKACKKLCQNHLPKFRSLQKQASVHFHPISMNPLRRSMLTRKPHAMQGQAGFFLVKGNSGLSSAVQSNIGLQVWLNKDFSLESP